MNTHLDKQSILDLYRSGALLDAIFDRFDSAFQEKSVISKCAEMHNEGEIDLLALVESQNFDRVETHRFFAGQHFYCQVIPRLKTSPWDMMKCVNALVEKGGQDLAAGQPNAVFREWCSTDLSRATAIIESSEAGDPLATDFLPLALTAGDMVQEAIRIADAYQDERRVCAITALGRMNYADLDSTRTALDALKRAIGDRVGDILYANALSSALNIADKAGSAVADGAADIVRTVCAASPGPQTQYRCAYVISANSSALNTKILTSLLSTLSSIPPELKSTLRALDNGLVKLLGTAFADEAIAFVTKSLTDAQGTLTLADFPDFGHSRGHRASRPTASSLRDVDANGGANAL